MFYFSFDCKLYMVTPFQMDLLFLIKILVGFGEILKEFFARKIWSLSWIVFFVQSMNKIYWKWTQAWKLRITSVWLYYDSMLTFSFSFIFFFFFFFAIFDMLYGRFLY